MYTRVPARICELGISTEAPPKRSFHTSGVHAMSDDAVHALRDEVAGEAEGEEAGGDCTHESTSILACLSSYNSG